MPIFRLGTWDYSNVLAENRHVPYFPENRRVPYFFATAYSTVTTALTTFSTVAVS